MRVVQILLAGFMIVVAGACGGLPSISISSAPPASTKAPASNKEKIVGAWEITKPDMWKGMTYDFSKDGKLKFSFGGQLTEGTYSVDGDSLKTTIKGLDQTAKIKSLTDKELVLEETKDGKMSTTEYKKK